MFTFKIKLFSIKKKFSLRRKTLATNCYDNIVNTLRYKSLYENNILKDSFSARLDFLTIIMGLVIKQLLRPHNKKFVSGQRFLFSRDLIEIAIDDIDGNLRQMGIGDMKFSKKMKNIALNLTSQIEKLINLNNNKQLTNYIIDNLIKENIDTCLSVRTQFDSKKNNNLSTRAKLDLWLMIIAKIQYDLKKNQKNIINISFPKIVL